MMLSHVLQFQRVRTGIPSLSLDGPFNTSAAARWRCGQRLESDDP